MLNQNAKVSNNSLKRYIVPLIRPATRLKMTGPALRSFLFSLAASWKWKSGKRSRLRTPCTRPFGVVRPPRRKRMIQTGPPKRRISYVGCDQRNTPHGWQDYIGKDVDQASSFIAFGDTTGKLEAGPSSKQEIQGSWWPHFRLGRGYQLGGTPPFRTARTAQ